MFRHRGLSRHAAHGRPGHRWPRRAAAVVALLAVSGSLVSCAAPRTLATQDPTSYVEAPLPDGAAYASAPTSPEAMPSAADCNATASLRPGPPGEVPPGGRVAAIAQRGRLIVGLDQGSNLFSFRDPLTGTLQGFDADIAREIARDIFGDPERIQFHILASAQREQALQESSVDVVVKTMSITCDRLKRVAFSTEYFRAQQRILALKDSPIQDVDALADRKVCIVKGTTSLLRIQQVQPRATILAVPTWADCLVALQQRQVDAISTDDAILAGLKQQDPYLDLVGPSLGPEPYGIGINKSDDELVRFVNGTLERLRADGTWNAIYNRWLSVLGPSPGPPSALYRD